MTEDKFKQLGNSHRIGILGEKIAQDFLIKYGYTILDRNFFVKIKNGPLFAEIDIIGLKDRVVTFFEVKTKINDRICPEEKVNYAKINKIQKTAQIWLDKSKTYQDYAWQVDVITVVLSFETRKARVTHFKNV